MEMFNILFWVLQGELSASGHLDVFGKVCQKDETKKLDQRTQLERDILCSFAVADKTRCYANQEVLF